MADMKTPKAKPKPSREVLDMVKAAKAKSKAHGSQKREDFSPAAAPVEKRRLFVG
jgi:hypothetical protein